ncbi:LVIVD repeat-containing protein [Nocardia grenadensis]|uniref:LVIVD repeat-containing protein n=1 Tax=Nocardia grenadensis TaxID=931537 RepID=UPI003D71B047
MSSGPDNGVDTRWTPRSRSGRSRWWGRRTAARVGVALTAVTVLIVGSAVGTAVPPTGFDEFTGVWPTAVGPASCRTGDRVETGIQGEVPLADRRSGRSTAGYNCNLDLVGQYQGLGAGPVSPSYKDCAYIASTFPTNLLGPDAGVHVVDVGDPAHPVRTAVLAEPAMLGGTWESLKVHEGRGLLVGTGVGLIEGAGFLSVYDISQDCAHPRLLNTTTGSLLNMPVPITTHEGDFSPDGNTYWASGIAPGWISAVDISDPANPMVVWGGLTGIEAHGMGFTPDGDTMFLANLGGLTVLDVSAVQNRAPRTVIAQPMPHIGQKFWTDGQINQHSVFVTYNDRPYIFTVDEGGSGGVKLMDVADPARPIWRNSIKLAINLPEHQDRWASSSAGNGAFGYDAHYCSVDRPDDPRALACGWIQSGIRVFDIRDPENFREIAYFNPPAQTGKHLQLPNSLHATLGSIIGPPVIGTLALARAVMQGHTGLDGVINDQSRLVGGDLSADWCLSPPEFHGELLYVSCMDNGFMVLRLDPAVYPPR